MKKEIEIPKQSVGMGIYSFHNIKKLVKKSEQSEQEGLTDCNSMDKSVSESRKKVGTPTNY